MKPRLSYPLRCRRCGREITGTEWECLNGFCQTCYQDPKPRAQDYEMNHEAVEQAFKALTGTAVDTS
jgi:hypothetical protein